MKKHTKFMFLFAVLAVLALSLAACAGAEGPMGPEGPQGPAGPAGPAGADGADAVFSAADISCTECHNDTSLITAKEFAWEGSAHGNGTAADYAGGRAGCTACHSGASFSAMVAEGSTPDTFEGVAGVTRQDCRTCHEIHTTYTGEDWALETTAAVSFVAIDDTFDGGSGNLCANCHQPRSLIAEADADGNIEVTSTHWGPHHGPQAAVLMGYGGAGDVEGSPSAHYSMVEDTCVACHMGEDAAHSFEPDVAACQTCHADIEDFDFSGLQTEVAAQLDELAGYLAAAGLLDAESDEPIVGTYPAAQSQALWNYIAIKHEDKSMGVHNPAYIRELLAASLAVFQ